MKKDFTSGSVAGLPVFGSCRFPSKKQGKGRAENDEGDDRNLGKGRRRECDY
jgi:hypothetical protein